MEIVKGFGDEVEDRIDKIHKGAFEDMIADASRPREDGGLMPIDTGDLQDSISVNGSVGLAGYKGGIASAPKNGKLTARWGNERVDYAIFVEGGTRFQRAQPFARTAVLKWPLHVRNRAAGL
ncbi:MAG: hypothetical protein K0U66_04205 [Gammaproteobacteria bacterium]|nr:hypothetical protein [Gammaproteobacteria bacterium]